ncbi:class I SAM-dependent methyltransferase [Nostoc sp.]|uniref:class I SAM-dependent methyltransferase n=1 Tax=Nostoc sp. TaxID=1180 RepID=UPI003593F5F4
MEKLSATKKPEINVSDAWEQYWNKTLVKSTPILWDANVERAAAVDLPRFQSFLDPQLPLIDFACGNGTQTKFLAQFFSHVIGIDVSKSALEMASTENTATNISYRLLDGLEPQQAEQLHSEIGDTNIYMRTGFHHIPIEKREMLAQSLRILLGKHGVMYLIELGAGCIDFFNSLSETYGKLPYELSLVMEHGIRPGIVRAEDIAVYFPDFDILSQGEDLFQSVHKLPDGKYATPPALWAVIKHH